MLVNSRFVCKNNGVIFENQLLQIGLKSEYRQNLGELSSIIKLSFIFTSTALGTLLKDSSERLAVQKVNVVSFKRKTTVLFPQVASMCSTATRHLPSSSASPRQ